MSRKTFALAVIDSGGANIGSVCYALERLGVTPELVSDPRRLVLAERAILPGVGAAKPAMARLQSLGMIPALHDWHRPLLGICLGMQLLFDHSEEGEVELLSLIPGRVRKMQDAPGIRIPHMGWNALQSTREHPLMAGIEPDAQAYFVHSYAAEVSPFTLASSEHGQPFTALVQRGNVAGAQFHPERSAQVGARILQNFLNWDGQ